MKSILRYSLLFFLGLTLLSGNPIFSQETGDYRSIATGQWTNLSTWEYYDGSSWITPSGTSPQGYPGQFTGTGSVIIQTGHVVTITNAGISTQPMGKLTILSGGQLYLTGTNPAAITFYLNTLEINVISTPTTGSIYFHLKVILSLPANAVVKVNPNGLIGTCNNNVEIWIGGVIFAACTGAPGTVYTFEELMQAGGTLNATAGSNTPQCEGTVINLSGNYSGAIGTTTSGGSTTGVNYSWSVTGPGDYAATSSSQNTTIPSTANYGIYTAILTVSTYLSTQLYTNSETIFVEVLKGGLWYGNSTDWHTASNWCGPVPTATTDVVIPADAAFKPVIGTNDAVCNDLTIEAGASLTINPGIALTVEGIISNEAGENGLVIKSDAYGTGSLIHSTEDVTARVERFLTPNLWHYTSSPVSDALSGVFLDVYLRTFDEQTYSWNPWIVPTDDLLEVMLGYAAWVPGDEPMTVTFNGKLNNGNQSINVTRNNSLDNPGWNLVGNPYPSALDWDAAAGWDKNSVNNTIYFYRGVSGLANYKYYVGQDGEIPGVGTADGTNEIPAMQGFFVRAEDNGTLSVNNNARIHSTQEFWKKDENNAIPLIRLVAESNGLADETVIRFYAGSDPNFDGKRDALKLYGTGYPQIFTITADQTELAISTLPEYDDKTVIPIGFIPATTGLHTISLPEIVAFESSIQLFLEDLTTGTIQKLSEKAPYSFVASTGDEPNRFLLHFSQPLGLSHITTAPVSIYSYDNSVYVNLTDNLSADVIILDMLGREINRMKLSGEKMVRIDLEKETGYYIVKVIHAQGVTSQKVFIRK